VSRASGKKQASGRRADAYHHGNLREALEHAALSALKSAEPRDLSLRRLAKDIGVSPGAPYRHFANKTELFNSLSLKGHRAWLGELRRIFSGAPGLKQQIPELVRSYLRFGRENQAYYKLMFLAGIPVKDPETGEEPNAASFHLLGDVIQAEAPALKREQVQQRTVAVFALLHGLLQLKMEGTLRSSFGEDIEEQSAIAALRRLLDSE
jgi:AcrR family transcriptional regulator